MSRFIAPLTWAWIIVIGGVLIVTPGGIDPIVTKIAGGISILLGVLGAIGALIKKT